MRSILAIASFAFAGYAAAQSEPQQNYPYTIDPETVDKALRDTWCNNQKEQCPLICLQQPGVDDMSTVQNDCDPDALTYACVCSNNVAPNITQFSQTLPYHICSEWGNNCVKNCKGDNTCADKCRSEHVCGAQTPYKPNNTASTTLSTASATSASASGASETSGSGSFEDSQGGNNDQGGAAALNIGQSYGLAILFASVFAGFTFIL